MATLYYYPDGQPIESDELLDATLKWALLFEQTADRTIGQHKTLYGERLSTVWLGLDHNYGSGPPLIFETMLFAPRREVGLRRKWLTDGLNEEEQARLDADDEHVKRNYPHDQLQLRYATKAQAEDTHEALWLQCLIPPRWRRFILGTIGGVGHWLKGEDECEDSWT